MHRGWDNNTGHEDNVSLETGEEGQHFVSLCCRHGEFLQRGGSMLHKDCPLTGAAAQAFVRGLHIARGELRPGAGAEQRLLGVGSTALVGVEPYRR